MVDIGIYGVDVFKEFFDDDVVVVIYDVFIMVL